MNRTLACFTIVAALGLPSCNDNSASPSRNNLNAPVVTNVTNSFTYSVRASQYSDNAVGTLTFTSDSLVVTLSSSEYVSGRAVVSVKDTLNAVIFSDTVQSNKTNVIVGLKTTRPKSYSVGLTNLTGKLVLVVVGQ